MIIVVVLLFTLACGFSTTNRTPPSERVIIRDRLPTLTPTPTPTIPATEAIAAVAPSTPTVTSGSTASAPDAAEPTPVPVTATSAAPTSSPPSIPSPIPVADMPEPQPSTWTFVNIQSYPDEFGDAILLYGEMINETGTTQELASVTGTFYNAQGQPIATQDDIFGYWPVEIVPAGGRMPFELIIADVQEIADFELQVNSLPREQTPHQDFQMGNVEPWAEDGIYCLTGQLQNLGAPLQQLLVVVAVLYNADNQIVKFGEYYEPNVANLQHNQAADFEICVETSPQAVARYELRAWGL